MLETAIITSGGEAPTALTDLVDQFANATDQLPCLTYEDLIYINPERDMRTFTLGAVGIAETDFYHGHRFIERHLEGTIRSLEYARFAIEQGNITRLPFELSCAVYAFEQTHALMNAITMRMNPDHFRKFRPYLTSHPIRNLKGPSGAFTAAIPVIDILISGEELPDSYFSYLDENIHYFPRQGRKDIQQARMLVMEHRTISQLLPTVDMNELKKLVREFRGRHYKGVRHQVPEVFTGEAKGTAGEDAPAFLRERMKLHTEKGEMI